MYSNEFPSFSNLINLKNYKMNYERLFNLRELNSRINELEDLLVVYNETHKRPIDKCRQYFQDRLSDLKIRRDFLSLSFRSDIKYSLINKSKNSENDN